MKARLALLAGILVLAASAAPPGASPASDDATPEAGAARKHCPAPTRSVPEPGERAVGVLQDSRLVRILSIGDHFKSRVYACYRRTGKVTKLGRIDGFHQIETFDLAGRFVAFSRYTTPDRGEGVFNFYVVDARRGKVTFALPESTIRRIPNYKRTGSSIVTSPAGGAAGALTGQDLPDIVPEDNIIVFAHKAGTGKRAFQVLDDRVLNNSIVVKGDTLSWRTYDDAAPHSFYLGR